MTPRRVPHVSHCSSSEIARTLPPYQLGSTAQIGYGDRLLPLTGFMRSSRFRLRHHHREREAGSSRARVFPQAPAPQVNHPARCGAWETRFLRRTVVSRQAPPEWRRAVNIYFPDSYIRAMQVVAGSVGVTGAGFIRAAVELAARRIAEQTPGTPQAAAAEAFILESLRIDRRPLWAPSLGLPAAAPEQQQKRKPANGGRRSASAKPEAK